MKWPINPNARTPIGECTNDAVAFPLRRGFREHHATRHVDGRYRYSDITSASIATGTIATTHWEEKVQNRERERGKNWGKFPYFLSPQRCIMLPCYACCAWRSRSPLLLVALHPPTPLRLDRFADPWAVIWAMHSERRSDRGPPPLCIGDRTSNESWREI